MVYMRMSCIWINYCYMYKHRSMYMYIHVPVPLKVERCCKPSSHYFHTQLPASSMTVHWGSRFPLPLNFYASFLSLTDKHPFLVMMKHLRSGATLGCCQYVHTCTPCRHIQLTVMCQAALFLRKKEFVCCLVSLTDFTCTYTHTFNRPAPYIRTFYMFMNRSRTKTPYT